MLRLLLRVLLLLALLDALRVLLHSHRATCPRDRGRTRCSSSTRPRTLSMAVLEVLLLLLLLLRMLSVLSRMPHPGARTRSGRTSWRSGRRPWRDRRWRAHHARVLVMLLLHLLVLLHLHVLLLVRGLRADG